MTCILTLILIRASIKAIFNFFSGSYMSWQINGDDENGEDNEPTTTYGPFPCKAIPKIIRKELNGEPLIVFSGGLPRASYGDKHTVSVIHNNQHVTFDLTSKVCYCLFVILFSTFVTLHQHLIAARI